MKTYNVLVTFDFTPDGTTEPIRVTAGVDVVTSEQVNDARAAIFISYGLIVEVV